MNGIAKLFGALHSLYGRPGVGVSVYSAPDSVLDFYRVSNVRMPLADPAEGQQPSRQTWIWGGGTAAHEAVLRTGSVSGKCA